MIESPPLGAVSFQIPDMIDVDREVAEGWQRGGGAFIYMSAATAQMGRSPGNGTLEFRDNL